MPLILTEITPSDDSASGAHHTLRPGVHTFGQSDECTVCVLVPSVSGLHARLTIAADGAMMLEDLGSTNGTFIDDVRITTATAVRPNQTITLGGAALLVQQHSADGRAPDAASIDADATIAVPKARTPSPAAPSSAHDGLPPELLAASRYEIAREIAHGGMGAVLAARQPAIRREVAMKVMLRDPDAATRMRFIEEAQITGQLEHPNIVPVHELALDEHGQPFYTMKLVKGITLHDIIEALRAGKPDALARHTLPALLTLFQKVCDALGFAHSRGVIHRDLKPANIIVGDFGEVLVMDWSLAKVIGAKETAAPANRAQPAKECASMTVQSARMEQAGSFATLDGIIMGTPQFMSPEQVRGETTTLDGRSDIFALGAILYNILTLQPPFTGKDVNEILDHIANGRVKSPIEITGTKPQRHLPAGKVPESLNAIVMKALTVASWDRYQNIAAMQSDLTAYQNGFATSAEKAGVWKQLTLFVKRHKAASIGVAAVLIIGSTLGAKAVIEGKRAEREAAVAKTALAHLKTSAPALLKLAESEADTQHFADALRDMDAALALDPALARWQRGWVLLGLERWSEAAAALRLARQHDPSAANLASILPAVEKLAAAPDAERWKSDADREVFAHLQTVEATGPALAFSGKLKLGAAERRKLATLGKGNYLLTVENEGLVTLSLNKKPLRSLEPIRALPIERLDAANTQITDLEPLRGLHLQYLSVGQSKVTDLSPLRGMPLHTLYIGGTLVRDLSPLSGMPLTVLSMNAAKIASLAPLAGMRLVDLDIQATVTSRIDALRGMPRLILVAENNPGLVDCSPLKGAPLEILRLGGTKVPDLSFVQGMPLRTLDLRATPVSSIAVLRGLPLEFLNLKQTFVSDLSALQGAPLKDLDLRDCKKLTDYTPILTLTRLERLSLDVLPASLLPLRASQTLQSIDADAYPGEAHAGPRPVAEFWKAYDAHEAARKK